MGDLPKGEDILRRQALEDELARTGPLDRRLDKAESLLRDFGRVWEPEQDPAKRARLITTLFDRVWQDGGTIVAVKPREPFLRYSRLWTNSRNVGLSSGVSKAGATGLEPALYPRDPAATA
jgi:hypothetical protein